MTSYIISSSLGFANIEKNNEIFKILEINNEIEKQKNISFLKKIKKILKILKIKNNKIGIEG